MVIVTLPYVSKSAAFFDLDKTIISRSSLLAFTKPFNEAGLISRKRMMKNFINLEARLLAKPGRAAGPQGLPEFEVRDVLPPRQRPCETPGVMRQIFERVFQRREPGEEHGRCLHAV